MAQLICITGMDGTGKSTLLHALHNDLDSVSIANIWDVMNERNTASLFRSKQDIDNYLCGLHADARVLFLAHAIQFSLNKAFQSGSEMVLLNGYVYKYFATELALGASPDLIEKLMSFFPVPDITICLELPPDEVTERKQKFSRYECGLTTIASKETFFLFQPKVAQEWKKMIQPGWHFLSSLLTTEELFFKTLQIIHT